MLLIANSRSHCGNTAKSKINLVNSILTTIIHNKEVVRYTNCKMELKKKKKQAHSMRIHILSIAVSWRAYDFCASILSTFAYVNKCKYRKKKLLIFLVKLNATQKKKNDRHNFYFSIVCDSVFFVSCSDFSSDRTHTYPVALLHLHLCRLSRCPSLSVCFSR